MSAITKPQIMFQCRSRGGWTFLRARFSCTVNQNTGNAAATMNIAKLRVFRGLGSKVLKSASIKNTTAIRAPRVASPHLRDGVVYSGVSSTGVCS